MTWQIELSEVAEVFLDKLYKADKQGVSQIYIIVSLQLQRLLGDCSIIWHEVKYFIQCMRHLWIKTS